MLDRWPGLWPHQMAHLVSAAVRGGAVLLFVMWSWCRKQHDLVEWTNRVMDTQRVAEVVAHEMAHLVSGEGLAASDEDLVQRAA